MIDVGVQTKGILPEMGIEEGGAFIAAAGFERVDFNLDAFLKNSDIYTGKINSFFDAELDVMLAYFEEYKRTFDEYGIKLVFSLKKGPIVSRDIYVTAQVNKLYKSEDERKMCVDFKYTTLQEEDLRFLYEKATKNLFI